MEKARTNTYNLLGEKLLLERKMESSEAVNGTETEDLEKSSDIVINKMAKVTEEDLMASNGVMHIIDTFLETASANPITTSIEKSNLTVFRRLVEAAGLDETYNEMTNVSFFVPTDKAFEQSPWKVKLEEDPESLKDNKELREFLQYHIGNNFIKTCNLSEDMIPTAAGKDLRINLYSTVRTLIDF